VPVDQAKTRLVKGQDLQRLAGLSAANLPYLPARFFESLLLLWVGFLMPRPSCLELYCAPPQKLTDTVGVGILDASLAQALVSLRDRGDLVPFHGLLELLERFGSDQLFLLAMSSTLLFSSSPKPPSP